MKLVKRVYSWETPEDMVCEYVRAVVRTNYYILTVEEERCNHDHSKTGLRNRQRVESHFIFLREHNRGKLWTDHASFWIDKTNGALKIVSAIPATKEYDLMQQGTQLNLAEMCE